MVCPNLDMDTQGNDFEPIITDDLRDDSFSTDVSDASRLCSLFLLDTVSVYLTSES